MKKLNIQFQTRWRRKELILFLEQLSLYISSGLPINRALSIIEEGSVRHRKVELQKMRQAIEAGERPSRVFARHITNMRTVIAIIEQGELSGSLAQSCKASQVLLERGDELTKKCLSALAYPLIIGIFAGLLTIGLVRGVMPQIIPLLEGLHVPLPLLTRVVISLSQGFISYGLIVGVGLVVIIVSLRISYKKFVVMRRALHYLILKTPLCGSVVTSYWLALFLRSCGTLIESGTSASTAYESAVSSISFIPLHTELSVQIPGIFEGGSLAGALRTRTAGPGLHLPRYIPALVSAGEASGTLGAAFIRAADIVDRDVSYSLKKLTSLIEPTMMAGMGCAVGGIALSIMMPIYDISRVLQK